MITTLSFLTGALLGSWLTHRIITSGVEQHDYEQQQIGFRKGQRYAKRDKTVTGNTAGKKLRYRKI